MSYGQIFCSFNLVSKNPQLRFYMSLPRESVGILRFGQFIHPQIARFMGPTCGPPGPCRPQMGPMLAPWNFQSGSCKRILIDDLPRIQDMDKKKTILPLQALRGHALVLKLRRFDDNHKITIQSDKIYSIFVCRSWKWLVAKPPMMLCVKYICIHI